MNNECNQQIKSLSAWRKAVFKRDKYQCQKCGLPHREYFSIPFKLRPIMQAHHIIGVKIEPNLILDLENGSTRCLVCHRIEHKKKKDQN